MNSSFIDTNIFLRFLTQDEEKQYQKCKKLFQKLLSEKINLHTSSLVIFEIIWTLISYYEEPKAKIVEKMISLLGIPSLKVENKDIFLEALLLWEQENIDFNDAYNFVWCRKNRLKEIISYDKHFDKLEEIKRVEP